LSVLIALTRVGMARLSWPGWLVTYWGGMPAWHGHTSQY